MTVPRQNHEVGESCVHSLPSCNDSRTWDPLHLPVPEYLLQLLIALDLPSVFQGAHAVSWDWTIPLWLCNCPAQKISHASLRGARQSRFSLLFFHPPPQCSTADESPTLPFLFLCLFHAIPFVRAGLHLSSPSMEILIVFQGSTHLYIFHMLSLVTPSLSPLSLTHPYHSDGSHHVLLCFIIFMYVSCLQALCWILYKRNLI